MREKNRLHHLARYLSVVFILLLATLYSGYRLDADPLWVDEVISMQRTGLADYVESTSPLAVWNRTANISDQVPGYYILLALWGNLTGTTPFALRVLSLLFGIISIAITFQIGRTLHSDKAGIASALLLASSAFYMLFLHEMRTYSLLVCLIASLIWCYWLIIHGHTTWWAQLGLVVAAAGMMYSYYLSIAAIATICVYHLIFVKKNREWWRVVILMGIAGALFLPWFLTSFSVFEDTVRNDMRTIHTTDFALAIRNFASAFSNQGMLLLGLLMVFAVHLGREWSRFAWFVLLFCLTLMIAFNQPFGVFVNLRYTLILWIPLAVVAGLGVGQLQKWSNVSWAIIAIIAIGGVASNFSEELESQYDLPIRYLPWDQLTQTLAPYEQAGDVLTFIASIEGNDWEGVHEERVMPHYFYHSPVEPVFIEDVRNLEDQAFLTDANRAAQSSDRVWLSYDPELRSWRTGLFQDRLLDLGLNSCGTYVDNDDLYLEFFIADSALQSLPQFRFSLPDASYAQLSSVHQIPSVAEDTLHLTHGWRLTDDFPRYQYSLAVHILDASGNLVAQSDYGLPESPFDCTHVTIPVEMLSTGTYTARSFVYDWQTGDRISYADSGETDVTLGTFSIK